MYNGIRVVKEFNIGQPAAKMVLSFIKDYDMKKRRIHDFIPLIKDYYTIYENGVVESDNSGIMKTRNRAGTDYQIINFMTVSGGKKTMRLHRLVMMAFNPVDNMEELEVNHIDGNKCNNDLSNLEWCTRSENQQHAYRTGLQKARKGESSNFSKLSESDIKKIFELRKLGYTQKYIANEVNCSSSNISYILNHKTWQP